YTMFGHTAIRLEDPLNRIDRVYNYGTFDFKAPGFFFKFLYGNLDYYLSAAPFEQFKQANVELGRSIVSQSLDLSRSQINELTQTLERSRKPENRSYRYRFFSQNCVTQVVDLLSAEGVGPPTGQIQAMAISGATYRQKLGTYLNSRPWMQLGINLMLGSGADQRLSNEQQIFLPNALHLALANTTEASGGWLVASDKTIATAINRGAHSTLPPSLVFWMIYLLITALTITSLLQGWQSLWIDRLLFGAAGLLGVIMAIGAFISLHEPLHNNWNLLWALPTHLLVAGGLGVANTKWLRYYFWLTLLLYTVVLASWTVIPQQLPAAAIPLICSLMVRSAYRLFDITIGLRERRLRRKRPPSATENDKLLTATRP